MQSEVFTKQLAQIFSQPYFSWITALLEQKPSTEIYLVGGAVRDAIMGGRLPNTISAANAEVRLQNPNNSSPYIEPYTPRRSRDFSLEPLRFSDESAFGNRPLNRVIKDYDFVVRGIPAQELQSFLSSAGIVNLVGRTFGVYKFIPEDGYEGFKQASLESFDIALPRVEQAWGSGGYHDVDVQSDYKLAIEEDLGRRDFTINAIAIRLRTTDYGLQLDEVTDPYNGRQDIEARIIRAVGDPKQRFTEDYTRMLRAIRFACSLDCTVEPATLTALTELLPRINDKRGKEFVAPREVVSRDLLKALYANPVRAFDLLDQSGAFQELIPELLAMKNCPQPEEFHSEGDVWTHTRLALQMLHTPEYANTFGAETTGGDRHYNALLIMAILLHDIGKPPMIQTPEKNGVERIRFDEHDTVGAELAREIAKRLALSAQPENTPLHVDRDKLGWLIKHHLLTLHTRAEDMKSATVEKYFFNPNVPGEELLRLVFCDASATIPKNDKPDLQNIFDLMARIKRMASTVKERHGLPKPLLNGDEIMKLLKIPAGPGVGEIIRALREEQLSVRVKTKEEVMVWLKKQFG